VYPRLYLFKRIQDAKILIDRHYHERLQLDDIARKVYLSKYHFMRLFKEAYGCTPHQYLMNRRIDKAKLLLLTDMTVSEVCQSVGFESTSSFSLLFKKKTGSSPTDFRLKAVEA